MINYNTYINTDKAGNILALSIITFTDDLPTYSANVILSKCTEEQINTIKKFNTFVATLPND